MNVGHLIDRFVLAYGILSIIVSIEIDICVFLVAPFYCSYDPRFALQMCIKIFKLMTSHEYALGSIQTCKQEPMSKTGTCINLGRVGWTSC